MAAILIAYSASPVHEAESCTTTSGTTTCTYSPSGSEDTFEVPDGVSSLHVVAIGAPGAVGLGGGTAGRGARVSGDLTGLVAGQTLYVEVGGAADGESGSGGFNGGGSSGRFGGGGGGASDVRTQPRTVPLTASDDSRLIVAGGGGGSADGAFCAIGVGLIGGAGGDAGSDGGDGEACDTIAGGTGGKAGDQSAGGAGGSPFGQSGSLGQGGNGGLGNGGGGGGYFGGGGGDSTRSSNTPGITASGGGGGGGSNLDPDGGPTPTIATGGPSITISYTETKETTPPTISVSHTGANANGWNKTSPVTLNVSASDTGSGLVASGPTCKDGNNALTLSAGTPGNWTASVSTEGTHSITCSVSDNDGNSASANDTVMIDTKAPLVGGCSVTPSKLSTSANNHKLVTINATVKFTDNTGGSGDGGFTLLSVTSNQPQSGLAKDDVANDIQGWSTGTADLSGQVRAERYGGARTYTLTYQGKDLAGNTTNCQATVTVPKGG